MIILKPGYFEERGITMTCEYCDAIFIIENREDLKDASITATSFDGDVYVDYAAQCPCCKTRISLGCIDAPPWYCGYKFLANRPDWKSRFMLQPKFEIGE